MDSKPLRRLSRERNNAGAALYNLSVTASPCHCPLSTLACHLPRPGESVLVGEALAFRDVFQQAPVSFIENDTSLPRAPTLGELARQRLRGQAWPNKTRKHSDTMSLTNRACIAVFLLFVSILALSVTASLDATSPSRGGFGIPQGLLLSPEALKSVFGERHLFAKGSPTRGAGAAGV